MSVRMIRCVVSILSAMIVEGAITPGQAADSVNVIFSYTNAGVTGVSLVGEFNGWVNAAWPMDNAGNGLWTRTVRLPVGINPFSDPLKGVPGAWQYKFYYSGASPWPSDPLEHHVNALDNYNSYIIVKDPTIYHLLPNQLQPIVTVSTPTVTASLFPKTGARVDTSTIRLAIDGDTRTGLGSFYDTTGKTFSYVWPAPLTNGAHTLILVAGSTAGATNADTVSFVSQSGFVQITTHGGFTTRNPLRELRGVVQGAAGSQVKLIRNRTDTTVVPLSNGGFVVVDTLKEGKNSFVALADSAGLIRTSDSVSMTLLVDHVPHASMGFSDIGQNIVLYADGSSDPDPGQTALLLYSWHADPQNPAAIGVVEGNSAKSFFAPRPSLAGDYFFTLVVTDPDAHADTTRNYFSIRPDHSISIPGIAGNPDWAKTGRIYFLFPKAVSPAGTLMEAAAKLLYIKDMGFNIIWLMPIMKNASPINNGTGPGYNIVDFYNVADEYGGNAAFASFMEQAHALGLKVILDITPNHTGRSHPFCVDAHKFGHDSQYWSWYEHGTITSNTNGLGDNLDADGFNYYGGFSEQLMNYNWSDIDARAEMINVYKHWIKQFGVDGYRFDVYWGPHRRYGEALMGKPVRDALKHLKPDILLLAEDDATGAGTEVIFADHLEAGINGGIDAAYDFNLYWSGIFNFTFDGASINRLQAGLDNGGFYPGKNALLMRYLESQDEDRIVSVYSAVDAQTSFSRTMPGASVLFTAPGLPMIWNGQEVGWGYGITGTKEARSRSVINWDYQGKLVLTPHYQKLATIRAQFPAFSQHKQDTNNDLSVNAGDASDLVRISSGNDIVYAFARPYPDQNGLTVVNFSSGPQQVLVRPVSSGGVTFSGGIQPAGTYYLNNVYENTRLVLQGSSLDSIIVTLPAYGTVIYTLSKTPDTLRLASSVLSVPLDHAVPLSFQLLQNYPNPFNPSTSIDFVLPESAAVSLKVYDLLGREVASLVDGQLEAGMHAVVWGGKNTAGKQMSSGMYFYQLSMVDGSGGNHNIVKKMLLIR